MNNKQQLALIDLFDQIKKAQLAQQKIKGKLVGCQKQLQIIFKKISRQNKSITPSLLQEYIKPSIQLTENDLYLIFSKFDSQLEGSFSIDQFKNELTPIIKTQINKPMSVDGVEQTLIQLFQCIIFHEDLLNVCRRNLKKIAPYQAFDQIAIQKLGYITKTQLKLFYDKNEISIKSRGLELLYHGLKRRSYRKINLEAFCQNLNPLQMGYYKCYQQSIDQDQRIKYQQKQREQAKRIKQLRDKQRKLERKQRTNQRVKQAEDDRKRYLQQLKSLKLRAQLQKLQRQSLQKTLQYEQKIRHDLQKQIQLYERESRCNDLDKKLINRMQQIRDQQLLDSRKFQSRIQQQQQYLQNLKKKVMYDKLSLQNQSDVNNRRIRDLVIEKQNDEIRQYKQRSLLSGLISPVTQKVSQHSIGKLYSKYPTDTPMKDLYKNSFLSTKGDANSFMYSSQPQLRKQFFSKYY